MGRKSGGRNVQQTPSDVAALGVLYQKGSWDAAYFDKRVGTYFVDCPNGYHTAYAIDRFSLSDAYINYTLRSGGRFHTTKLRRSFTNLFANSAGNGIYAGEQLDARGAERAVREPFPGDGRAEDQRRGSCSGELGPEHHADGDVRDFDEAAGYVGTKEPVCGPAFSC